MKDQILVQSIYGPVIQGEGPVAGLPTIFVRLGGCNDRCVWCDTLYAVLPEFKSEWKKMSSDAVVSEIEGINQGYPYPMMVTFSGGNPGLQDLSSVIERLKRNGHVIAAETQGNRFHEWMRAVHTLVLSPKPPSSESMTEVEDKQLERCAFWPVSQNTQTYFKVVVFDDRDWEYALQLRRKYFLGHRDRFYLQAGTTIPEEPKYDEEWANLDHQRSLICDKLIWLQQKVIHEGDPYMRVLPQIHSLLYGAAVRSI